jgi:hypothetical protein
MNRRQFLTTSAALGGTTLALRPALGAQPPAKAASAPPAAPLPRPIAPSSSGAIDIGTRAQLFVEPFVVAASERIAFTVHPARKHPLNPLLKPDRPWEGWRINIYGTVLFDEEARVFKMWYVGNTSEAFPDFATHYAVSRDGVSWEKPLVGTAIAAAGSARHNAVLAHCQIASVFKDRAEPDPARRYKMVAIDHRPKPIGGPHALVSPDGLNWTRISTQNLFRSNDVATVFYDWDRKLYVALPKFSNPVRGVVRRCFALTTSADLLTWPDPRLFLVPDRRDDTGSLSRIEAVRPMLDVPDDPALMRTEFYGVATYQAESCLVAFPWVFTINANAKYPLNRNRNHEGPCDIQIAATRDLETWDRTFRTPVVPLGKLGEWDSGFLTSASYAIRHGDEVRLYYGGGNYTHGNPIIYDEYEGTERGTKYSAGIGLATWPLDRFVSADGGPEGGTLTTVPLHFSGNRLELNVNAAKGRARVELLDAAGRGLPGFGLSDPVTADSLRATVAWKGQTDVGALRGKPVSLRFTLQDAELFSFAFRA